MSMPTKDPLDDYINGAKKLGGNEQFRQDMLDRIASHDTQTVSGTKHIYRTKNKTVRHIAIIAAAFCCTVGVSAFAGKYLYNHFDPHRPVDSITDYSSTDTSHNDDSSNVLPPNHALYEPLMEQLLQVEQQITETECQLANANTEEEINRNAATQQTLQSQKEMILGELCPVMRNSATDMLLAYAGYDSAKQRLRLTVINGGSQSHRIPSYCTISDANGIVASGYLTTDNPWNLHHLDVSQWATLYCDLNYAALPDADAASWKLAKGEYTVQLCDALLEPTVYDSNVQYQTTLQIGEDAKLTAGKGSYLHNIAEELLGAYNDKIPHVPFASIAEEATLFRQGSIETLPPNCEYLMEEIIHHNGTPDFEASGVYLSVYHIGDSGNTALVTDETCCYYLYRDPQTGQVQIGALTDVGSFEE